MTDRWRVEIASDLKRIRLVWSVNPQARIPLSGQCIAYVTQGKLEGARLWMMKAINHGGDTFRRRVPQGGWVVRRRKHPNGKPLLVIKGHGVELGLLFYRVEGLPPNFLLRLADVLGVQRTNRRAPIRQEEDDDEAPERAEHEQEPAEPAEQAVEAGDGHPAGGGPPTVERGGGEASEAGPGRRAGDVGDGRPDVTSGHLASEPRDGAGPGRAEEGPGDHAGASEDPADGRPGGHG